MALMADLRIMFPLFVDDFIHHIHEEESRLFKADLRNLSQFPINQSLKGGNINAC